LVPNNLKSLVNGASFYDPEVNRTAHYSVGVLPARPGKPRDKAKVEAGVRLPELHPGAAARADLLVARRMQRSDRARDAKHETIVQYATSAWVGNEGGHHGCLHPRIVALDFVEQLSTSTNLAERHISLRASRSYAGYVGYAILSDKAAGGFGGLATRQSTIRTKCRWLRRLRRLRHIGE
jgi:hypothetical protein